MKPITLASLTAEWRPRAEGPTLCSADVHPSSAWQGCNYAQQEVSWKHLLQMLKTNHFPDTKFKFLKKVSSYYSLQVLSKI